ncbi:MAG: hypothetical protein AVDCRST_MAG53-724, partial [uncultured Solirubrobacteraceae bacterium]
CAADMRSNRTLRMCVSCPCVRCASATRQMPGSLRQSSLERDSTSCWTCGPASPGRPMSAALTDFVAEV